MMASQRTASPAPACVLITGAAGFIGSAVTRLLADTWPESRLMLLDNLSYAGHRANLEGLLQRPGVCFVEGDITDAAVVASLMQEARVCVNIAAQTHVDRSIHGPEIFTHTNVLGTQTLLEAARQAGIDKFVQVSTDEVYGSLPLEAVGERFTEDSPLDPSSPYAASKAAADLLALSYFKTWGFPVCITRCSNNYGPRQFPEKLIPLFIRNALAESPVPVYGDGLNVRDWIHVDDHARALLRVIQTGEPGRVYNVGADNEQPNLAITRAILDLTGKPQSLIRFVDDRLGHDRRYAIDSTRIRTELGWQPTMAFHEGLRATVGWYQSHPDWITTVTRASDPLTTSGSGSGRV